MALRKAQRDGKSDQASDRQAFHVKRLDAALSKIDDRITTLGGSISSEDPQALYKEEQASASLESLLRDAIGLSYWMEFMERRRRTPLVQFWLTVDGLRDPLDDNSDQSAPEVGQAAKEDAELLLMTFFNDNGPVATACSPKLVDVLRKFVKDPVTRNSDAKQLRTVIHALQGEAVEEMESRDYPAFKDSDLFVKMPITLLSGYPRRENISHSTSELAETSTSTAPTLSTLTGVTANATPSYPTLFNPARLLASRRSDTAPPQVDASEAVVDSPRANSPSFPSTPRSQPSSGLTHSASSFAFLMGLGEDEANRAPLFTTGPLTPSADILNPYEEDDRAQAQTMRAIQDALTSIVEQPTHTQSPALQPQASERGQASSELQRAISDAHATPSKTQSAPLSDLRRHVSAPSTKRRDRFFENEEPAQERSNSFASVLRSDSPSQESPSKELDERPLAADQIRDRVKHLSEQDDLVTSLLRRAEHTRNSRELKVLLRSLEAVRGERRMLELRLLGESNSPVSGHASRIQISSTSTGGPEGKEFVLYIVSVHQEAGPGESATGWMIARRYSEFFDLHVAVKEKFPTARHFEFPSKRLVTSMSPALVEQRRGALERYLQVSDVCFVRTRF